MSGPSIGYSTLQVVPSLRGLQGEVQRQLGGMAGPIASQFNQAGDQASKSFGGRLMDGARTVAGDLGNVLTSAVTSAGAVAGGLFASSLMSGWDRFTMIEDATASLTITLGDAAEAKMLLDDVMDVVIGTPFDFNEFARGAQQLVGFGVEAGKVPGYLTAIGESAATQGSRADQFAQRLLDTFGRMTARGRVQLRDIWTIAETGVPALTILANAFEVTSDQMAAMISDPDTVVDASEALEAISHGIIHGSDGVAGATIAFQGNMEALRQTLTGVRGGFRSAIARFGVAVLEPFRDALWQTFASGTEIMDDFTGRMEGWGQRLSASPGMRRFVDFMEGVPDRIGPGMDRLRDLGPTLGAAGGALAAFAAGGISRALGPLGVFIPQISMLTGALAGFVAMSPELRSAVGQVAGALQGALGQAVSALMPVIPPLADVLVVVGVAFADVLTAVVPLIGPLGELVAVVVSSGMLPGLEVFAALLGVSAEALVLILTPIVDLVGWLVEIPGVAEVAGLAIAGIVAVQMVNRYAGFIDLVRTGLGVGLLEAKDAAGGLTSALANMNWADVKRSAGGFFDTLKRGAARAGPILGVVVGLHLLKEGMAAGRAEMREWIATQESMFDLDTIQGMRDYEAALERQRDLIRDTADHGGILRDAFLFGPALEPLLDFIPGVEFEHKALNYINTLDEIETALAEMSGQADYHADVLEVAFLAVFGADIQAQGQDAAAAFRRNFGEIEEAVRSVVPHLTGMSEHDIPLLIGALQDAGLSVLDMSNDVREALIASLATTPDWVEGIRQATEGAAGHFADFSEEAQESLGLFIEEMETQAKAQSEWYDNLTIIAERGGVDLAEQWAELGPEFAGVVAEVASAGDTGFAEMNWRFVALGGELNRDLGTEWMKNPVIMTNMIREIRKIVETEGWGETEAKTKGVAVMAGFILGLEGDNFAPLRNTITRMMNLIPTQILQLMNIGSPAKRMIPYGEAITQGLAVGILHGEDELAAAQRQLIDNMMARQDGGIAQLVGPGASPVLRSEAAGQVDNRDQSIVIEGFNRDPVAIVDEMEMRRLRDETAEF